MTGRDVRHEGSPRGAGAGRDLIPGIGGSGGRGVGYAQDSSDARERLDRVFTAQRAAVERDPYPSAQQRVEWLSRVRPMIARHRGAVLDALDADFGGHSRDWRRSPS